MNKKEEMQALTLMFQKEFKERFGIVPSVVYNWKTGSIPRLTLKELITIANSFIDLERFPDGVKSHTRKREVLLIRQSLIYFAREMGYTHELIGCYLRVDHSTSVHSVNVIRRDLEMNNQNAVFTVNLLKNAIQTHFGDDGDVQSDKQERTDS